MGPIQREKIEASSKVDIPVTINNHNLLKRPYFWNTFYLPSTLMSHNNIQVHNFPDRWEWFILYTVHFMQKWKSETSGMEAFFTRTKACQKFNQLGLFCHWRTEFLSRVTIKVLLKLTILKMPFDVLYFCDHVNRMISVN